MRTLDMFVSSGGLAVFLASSTEKIRKDTSSGGDA